MTTRKNIAIIGTGISGLGAAYLLHRHHNITVYEKNNYIGGHSRTIQVGDVPVDTGFIVFNYRNYPLLTGLFAHLQVPVVKSDMSFGVSIHNGWFEYGTQHLKNVFAQKRNIFKADFWRMIADILRFNREAKAYINSDPTITLGECLKHLKMRRWFCDYYLLAMGGAIWSTPLTQMYQFPASAFLRFFDNHGLLSVNDQPQWYTVQGGSREYVKRLTAGFIDSIMLNTGVARVSRAHDGVHIVDSTGQTKTYDDVVFACHADQALTMIEQPTDAERTVLQAFGYQPNRAVLHSDISFMPQRKQAWASWVYLSEKPHDNQPRVSLSYWMNRLQPLPTTQNMLVTLNPSREPQRQQLHNDYTFEHPVFDEAAIKAQSIIETIQGKDRFWFCGAYQRYGFHEDGLNSAVNMARAMGIEKSWI